MALQIQDITIWLIVLAVFNYVILYRRNKFFGSIGYFLFGMLMYATRTEFGYTEVVYGYIALFITMGALVNIVYEIIGTFGGGTKKMSSFMKGKRKR